MTRAVRPVAVGVTIAVLAAGATCTNGDGDGDGDRPRKPAALRRVASVEAPDLSGDLVLDAPASSVRILYRVRTPGSADFAEQLWARRPFESRLETYEGTTPGPPRAETESGVIHQATRSGGAQPVVVARPPSIAASDLRVDPVLGDAVAAGILLRREWRHVGDRACQVFRAGTSVTAGELRRAQPRGEFADVCVDRAGHLLEEWWVGKDGRPIRQRLAVEVEDNPTLTEPFLRLPTVPTAAPDQGAGFAKAVTDDSKPPEADFYVLDAPPAGFTHLRRYIVVPPQAGLVDPAQRGTTQAGVADVWTRGPDFLVVDQGGTLSAGAAFTYRADSTKVDLGPLGQGEELASLAANEVRVILPTKRHIRVYGTLRVAELADVARRLRATPGGTLTLAEPSS